MTVTWRTPRNLRPLFVMALALTVGTACNGFRAPSESPGPGNAWLPEPFPTDFPVPAEAVVDSTLVDRANHRSEASLSIDSDLVTAVQYFHIGLVNEGYVVEASEGDETSWRIEFVRGELRGAIELREEGGVTAVFVEMNVS